MASDEKFMRIALAEARKGLRLGQRPFAGCLVKQSKVIGVGHNTVHLDDDVAAHGEINVLRNAARKTRVSHLNQGFKGSTMYTTCEPCPMCLGACKWAGVKRVVYGISLQDLVNIESGKVSRQGKPVSYTKEGIRVVGGVLRLECAELFLEK